MLDIYICEDNSTQRQFVNDFITNYCTKRKIPASIVLATNSPAKVLSYLENKNRSALYFLDIDLKAEINGIELARQIREKSSPEQKIFIVFLTSHAELTMMTFQYKIEAMDFIVKDKPVIMKPRISECILTALSRIKINNSDLKQIQLTVNDQILKINVDEIIFIETTHIRHKLRLHTQNRVLEFNGELKNMEEKLGQKFIRSHKSFLINKDKIVAINKKENTITMSNNSICLLSRNAKKQLI